MKRRAIQIVVLLLLGAIVNVAVAWAIAQTVNATLYTQKRVPLGGSIVWSQSKTCWTFMYLSMPGYASIWASEDVGARHPRQIDVGQLPQWSRFREPAGTSASGTYLPKWAEYAWGWPLLSLTQRQEADTATGIQRSFDTIHAPFRTPTTKVPRSEKEFLPIGVIVPGFVINTIFYAVVLGVLWFGTGAVRRMVRRRRGLCPACAYPIGSSAVCTECGRALLKDQIGNNVFRSKTITPIVAAALTCSVQFGCTWDLSKYPPYSHYIGRELTLNRPMELRKPSNESSPKRYSLDDPHSPLFHDHGTDHYKYLPAGTRIRITSVGGGKLIGIGIGALGELIVENHERPLQWGFHWGGGSPEHIELTLAPWEDAQSIPPGRAFKDKGRTFVSASSADPRGRMICPTCGHPYSPNCLNCETVEWFSIHE